MTPYEKYFYRVATVSKTKDVGAPGRPVEIFVAGAFNRAPVEISSITNDSHRRTRLNPASTDRRASRSSTVK